MRQTFPQRPQQVYCIGRNYAEHAREFGNAASFEEPIVFLKASSCLISEGAAIEISAGIGRVDFEGELAVVIHEGGRNIAEENAMQHVAGYTLFNDVTARDLQKAAQAKGQPWFRAKSFATSGPLLSYFVGRDEIPDPHALRLITAVNGETRQDGSTGDMIFRVPFLVAYLSRWFTLEAGDIVATGTPSGVGPIVAGDVVSVAVAEIGTLENPVISVG